MSNKQNITLETKLEIIKALDSGKSIRKVADFFNVSKGAVQNVKEKKRSLSSTSLLLTRTSAKVGFQV